MKLTIEMDQMALDALDSSIPAIIESTGAHELGMTVTREVAARVALLRGLKLLQARQEAQGAVRASKPAEVQPEAPVQPGDVEPERDVNGNVRPPTGWHKWTTGKRMPESHVGMHAYYKANGWDRWWGAVGDDGKGKEFIEFYWSQSGTNPDLSAYDGVGLGNKSLLVQATPWGPGHIIPAGW
jgi:hypothetical protein|tara:strand:- start:1001 stop:1549 length:549 start_codon:yes stop_codon:yes gene_type:complete